MTSRQSKQNQIELVRVLIRDSLARHSTNIERSSDLLEAAKIACAVGYEEQMEYVLRRIVDRLEFDEKYSLSGLRELCEIAEAWQHINNAQRDS